MQITAVREGQSFQVTELDGHSTLSALLYGIEEACNIERPFQLYLTPVHATKDTKDSEITTTEVSILVEQPGEPVQSTDSDQKRKSRVAVDVKANRNMRLEVLWEHTLKAQLEAETTRVAQLAATAASSKPPPVASTNKTPVVEPIAAFVPQVTIYVEGGETTTVEPKEVVLHMNSADGYLSWGCTACKWINENARSECFMCHKDRHDMELWMCAACTFRQNVHNVQCAACDAKRPAYVHVPQHETRLEVDGVDGLLLHRQESLARQLSSAVVALTRTVSMRGQQQEFFCEICMCNCTAADEKIVLDCLHSYCKDCFTNYLTFEVMEGRVTKIVCCEFDCEAPVKKDLLLSCIDTKTKDRYVRFLKQKENDNYRACPDCNTLTLGSSAQKNMTCDSKTCSATFCFDHSNAHANGTCKDYVRKMRKEFAADRQYIAERTVLCPSPFCRVPIVKSSGCNHMRCTHCQTEFCYLCGGFYLGGLHFAPFWLVGCPGMQSTQMPANYFGRWYFFLLRWLILFPLSLVVISVVLAVCALWFVVWLITLAPALGAQCGDHTSCAEKIRKSCWIGGLLDRCC